MSSNTWSKFAVPFLRQPFRLLFSKKPQGAPRQQGGTYDQFLSGLAPYYLDLLTVALTWTLPGNGNVTLQESMDAYTGTYLSLDMTNDSKENANEEDFNLHAEQIKAAGRPFLDIADTGTTVIVRLTDPAGIFEYCVDSVATQEPKREPCAKVCARCKTDLNPSHTFSLSRKAGLLSMATMYRKLSPHHFLGTSARQHHNRVKGFYFGIRIPGLVN